MEFKPLQSSEELNKKLLQEKQNLEDVKKRIQDSLDSSEKAKLNSEKDDIESSIAFIKHLINEHHD